MRKTQHSALVYNRNCLRDITGRTITNIIVNFKRLLVLTFICVWQVLQIIVPLIKNEYREMTDHSTQN